MSNLVLTVDKIGNPVKWINPKHAVAYYALGEVIWEIGDPVAVFRSGISRISGLETVISPAAIIGVDGKAWGRAPEKNPHLANKSRRMLFARDKHICAYCGHIFNEADLSKDHILPLSRGGRDLWMNVVTSCKPCNSRKAARLPHEAGMSLLYLPYIPNRYEGLILRNRKILADQMEFLMAKVPKNSRLWI
jgi:hypothetical protein